jgi:hypothetical protein
MNPKSLNGIDDDTYFHIKLSTFVGDTSWETCSVDNQGRNMDTFNCLTIIISIIYNKALY